MYCENRREYSNALGREMAFRVYGRGGKPVLALPCRCGGCEEWERHGMTVTLGDALEREQIQLFCVDTLDAETVADRCAPPEERVRCYEQWFRWLTEELTPCIRAINGGTQDVLAVGFDVGAYHAANLFFRRPDLFDSLIALSGVYDTDDFYGGYMDEVVYANDPCVSLSNMPLDHPYIRLYNRRRAVFCTGRGAGEQAALEGTRRLDGILKSRGIRAWIDYWGGDVGHEWFWWKKQLRYFLPWAAGIR